MDANSVVPIFLLAMQTHVMMYVWTLLELHGFICHHLCREVDCDWEVLPTRTAVRHSSTRPDFAKQGLCRVAHMVAGLLVPPASNCSRSDWFVCFVRTKHHWITFDALTTTVYNHEWSPTTYITSVQLPVLVGGWLWIIMKASVSNSISTHMLFEEVFPMEVTDNISRLMAGIKYHAMNPTVLWSPSAANVVAASSLVKTRYFCKWMNSTTLPELDKPSSMLLASDLFLQLFR